MKERMHQNETTICAVHRGSKHADLSATNTTACNKPQQDVQSVQNRHFLHCLPCIDNDRTTTAHTKRFQREGKVRQTYQHVH